MFVFTEEELKRFLSDEPFYNNQHSFCLGKTLAEAGEIFRKIMAERKNANVGNPDAKSNGYR
ncbi:MAG: hypothetical protein IJK26_09075 [Clostridia bacterium]|nr:hypothetical protein [Clostridia bacterium]